MELRYQGLIHDRQPEEIERLQQRFQRRLVAAVQHCLQDSPPALLVQAVTTMMSQSGLANVERACDRPQVFVCGGEQHVQYDLVHVGEDTWEVSMLVRKEGFEQCMVYAEEGISNANDGAAGRMHLDPVAVSCAVSSCIQKSCRLHVRLLKGGLGAPAERMEADVVELHNAVTLLDSQGQTLPGLGLSDGVASRGGAAARLRQCFAQGVIRGKDTSQCGAGALARSCRGGHTSRCAACFGHRGREWPLSMRKRAASK